MKKEENEVKTKDWKKIDWIIYILKVIFRIERLTEDGNLVQKQKIYWYYGQDTAISDSELRIYVHFFFAKLILLTVIFWFLCFFAVDFFPFIASSTSAKDLIELKLTMLTNKFSAGILFKQKAMLATRYIQENNLEDYIVLREKTCLAVALICSFICSKKSLEPQPGSRKIKGMDRVTGDKAKEMFQKNYVGTEPFFGGFRVSNQAWNTGAVITGQPGSGKTTILAPLIRQMFLKNEKVFLLDIKRDYLKKMPKTGHDYIIAPWLISDVSVVWDVGRDINTVDKANQIASVLFPVSTGEGAVWDNASRVITAAVFNKCNEKKFLNYSWSDISYYLSKGKAELINEIKDPFALKILNAPDATAGSVEFTYITKLQSLTRLGEFTDQQLKLGAKKFSVSEWAKNPNYKYRQIFFGYDKQHEIMSDFLIRAMIDFFATFVGSIDSNNKDIKNVVFDEVAQLKKISSLPDFPALGREKNIRTITAFQLENQFKEIYGNDVAKSFFANATTKIICKMMSGEAAEEAAKSLGQIEETSWKETQSQQQGALAKKSISGSQETKVRNVYLGTDLSSRLGWVSRKVSSYVKINSKKHYKYRPTKIRALLVMNKYYEIDFEVEDFEEQNRNIREIPTARSETRSLRKLFESNETPAIQIAKAKKNRLANELEICDFLRAEDMISDAAYSSKNKKVIIEELKAAREMKAKAADAVTIEIAAKEISEVSKISSEDYMKELAETVGLNPAAFDAADTGVISATISAIDAATGLLSGAEAPVAVAVSESESKENLDEQIQEKLKKIKEKSKGKAR